MHSSLQLYQSGKTNTDVKMKDKKTILIIGAILVVVLFSSNFGDKQASAGLEASMILSADTVSPGESITITYHPNTMNYLSLILDVPTGWIADKTASPDGKIRTTADGSDAVITWTAPLQPSTDMFTGQYVISPDTDWTNFQGKVVVICSPHADYRCSLGDVYWRDSCGNFQEIKEDCPDIGEVCSVYGPSFCDPLSDTIKHERTCTTSSCDTTYCDYTELPEINIDVDAPNSDNGVCLWSCLGNACEQNTPADSNYDGCVADSEFPSAVYNWKQQTGGITDLIFPSVVAKWKNQENC